MSDHACKIYATLEFEPSGLQVKRKRESIMSLMHGFYERGGPMIRMHHELRQIKYSPSAPKRTADSSLPNVKSFVQIERDRPVFRLH